DPGGGGPGVVHVQHRDPGVRWQHHGLSLVIDADLPAHRDGARATHLAPAPRDGAGVGELEGGNAIEEPLDGHPELHPGQVRAEAAVDARTEGEVAVSLPVDDELVGAIEVL